MNILNIQNMTKVYGDKVVFDHVSLGIHEGEKLGIIGINGTGKSTLLKMIAGLEEADTGDIIKNNQADIAYLAQDTDFRVGDTVLSYVCRGKVSAGPNRNLESEAKTILKKMHVEDMEACIETLSGGEKKRIAMARVLLAPAKILLLDEPTNHLDNGMIVWLEEYLAKYKGCLIMVTHDRYFLDRVVNKIVEIDKGKLYTYDTNYSGFLELKQQRLESEKAGYRKVQSILRTELEWVKRGAKARSTKQKARLERFGKMQNMEEPVENKQVEIDSMATRMGKKSIEINGISKAYGNKELIKDFTYYTVRNERIGIVGENGCGKTTLIKMILGIEEPDKGSIHIGETIKFGYFSQMAEEMNLKERVIDSVKDVAEYIQTGKGMVSASQMCERFLFTPEIQYNLIGRLSGGERRRLCLLKVLMTAPNVLVLDEPTNDLDVTTLAVFEDYLDSFEGIVIAVSHDRYFLDRIADRILAFEENGKITRYEGNYTDYMSKVSEKNNSLEEEAVKTANSRNIINSKDTWKNNREKKLKFSYKEQREFDTIDGDIELLEGKIGEIEKEMEAAASQYGRLQELTEEKEALEQELELKMERWVYLNDLAEKIAKL